jgi:hypothetical protein
MPNLLILDPFEIEALTGYSMPCKQLAALQAAGYARARRGRNGEVILERAHFQAVCRGEFVIHAKGTRPAVRLDFLNRTA